MSEITEIISSVGFPIASFLLMYFMVNKQLKENTEAINNNTNLMIKVLTYLEARDGSDIDGE